MEKPFKRISDPEKAEEMAYASDEKRTNMAGYTWAHNKQFIDGIWVPSDPKSVEDQKRWDDFLRKSLERDHTIANFQEDLASILYVVRQYAETLDYKELNEFLLLKSKDFTVIYPAKGELRAVNAIGLPEHAEDYEGMDHKTIIKAKIAKMLWDMVFRHE